MHKFLLQVLDNLACGVLVLDVAGQVRYANSMAGDILGRPVISVAADTWAQYYGVYLSDQVTLCPLAQIPFATQNMGKVLPAQSYFIRHSDGTGYVVQISAQPVFEEDASLAGMQVLLVRLQAEPSYNEVKPMLLSEKSYKEAQRLGRIGSWEVNALTNTFVWSEYMYEVFGLDPKLPAPHIDESQHLYTPQSYQQLKQQIYDAKIYGIPFESESEFIRSDGRHGWIWRKVDVRRNEQGEIVKVYGICHDITERKQAELKHRAALVREVHHRIKNNLQGITGVLAMAVQGSSENFSALQKAITQVQSIALIHGLQGKTAVNQVNLCEMAAAISSELQTYWKVPIRISIAADASPFILHEDEAVPVALVLNELLTNAVKHGLHASEIEFDIALLAEKVTPTVQLRISNDCQEHITFDLEQWAKSGSGLDLIRVLIPKHHASLEWQQAKQQIVAVLHLQFPVVFS
jgi:two-component sensor histidine kinase/PAS domain-containing protein